MAEKTVTILCAAHIVEVCRRIKGTQEVGNMACGRNGEYNNTCNWSRVDCSGTNRREYKPCCGNWDSRGFEWLEAMQAAAANQCEEATPVCSRTGRDNYFLEIVSLLMALMHHRYHE